MAKTDIGGAFVSADHFDIRSQEIAEKNRPLFHRRAGNPAHGNLFRLRPNSSSNFVTPGLRVKSKR